MKRGSGFSGAFSSVTRRTSIECTPRGAHRFLHLDQLQVRLVELLDRESFFRLKQELIGSEPREIANLVLKVT